MMGDDDDAAADFAASSHACRTKCEVRGDRLLFIRPKLATVIAARWEGSSRQPSSPSAP
jgi:hypothetical protein